MQLGGQTPLKLTRPLEAAGVTILGTSPDAIDIAEDRRRFEKIAREVGLTQPPNGTATNVEEAVAAAQRIGYPVLVRPSYVLGGRAMQIVYDAPSLEHYFDTAVNVSEDRPVLIDRFLEDAFEVDVDAISDGTRVVIGGLMQHIEAREQRELMTCDEAGLRDEIRRADRVRAKAQVGGGQRAGLLGVVDEVALRIAGRLLANDLDRVLVCAHCAVRAEAPENAAYRLVWLDGEGWIIGETGVCHVVIDANRKVASWRVRG